MASLKKNVAGQLIFFGLNQSNGAPRIGAVFTSSAWVTVDGGAQAGFAGVFAELGHGQYSYAPTQAETNGSAVSLQMVVSGANALNVSLFTDNIDPVSGLVSTSVGAVQGAASNIKKNQTLNNFKFVMINSATNQPLTGAAVSGFRSIDGNPFAPCAGSVSEIGNGWYTINLFASDLNGNVISLNLTALNANPTNIELITQP